MRKLFLLLLLLPTLCIADSEVTLSGKTAAAHIIQDEGTSLPPRSYLNFTGTGITCTDTGGKTVCDSSGGGGGIITLANGGWGLTNTRTRITTTGTQNNYALSSVWLDCSIASGLTFTGFAAQPDGTMVTVTNEVTSAQTVSFLNQSSSSSAANRFHLPQSQNYSIAPGNAVSFRYDGNQSMWVVVDGYQLASPSVTGILSAADYSTFNAKVGGSGVSGAIAFFNGTQSLTSDIPGLSFDTTYDRLGVGLGFSSSGHEEAVGDFMSNSAELLTDPSSFTATLQQFILSAPSAYTVTQQPGHLYAPTSFSGSVASGTTNYNAGDVIDYRITAYYYDGGLPGNVFAVVNSLSTGNTITTGTGAGDGDQVNLSWTNNTTGTATISGYVIERQVNGGGYADGQDVGLATSFSDVGTGWGAVSLTPTFLDFVANGSTRNYAAYTKDVSPTATTVYSVSNYPFAFNDDNTGNPYVLQHTFTVPSGVARILNTDLSTHVDSSGSFYEVTNSPFVAGTTVTPNTYGILSDGVALNRDYTTNNYSPSTNTYSVGQGSGSVVDPNNGQYYYISLSVVPGNAAYKTKIIRQINGGGYIAGKLTSTGDETVYDDGTVPFSDGITITPTNYYAPAGLFHSHGSTIADPATIISRSLDGSYSRFEFQDNTSTVLGYLEQTSSYNRLSVPVAGVLSYGTTNRFTWDNTGIGFFGVTPVAKPGATTDLGVVLSNLGLRTAGTAYPITTSGAVATGALTVHSGSNTVYYCNGGVSVGNLCRGNGCSCVAGTWTATSLKID